MPDQPETPFDSIEGALEYVSLLADSVEEARGEIVAELEQTRRGAHDGRQADALRIVAYKLDRLSEHAQSSRRLLNDLRMLRRLLQEERRPMPLRPRTRLEGEVEPDG
jgi:hypothetical protein